MGVTVFVCVHTVSWFCSTSVGQSSCPLLLAMPWMLLWSLLVGTTVLGASDSCFCTLQGRFSPKKQLISFGSLSCHCRLGGGCLLPSVLLVTFARAFSSSNCLVAFSKNPPPKNVVFFSLFPSRELLGSTRAQATLWHFSVIEWDTLPSRIRTLWISRINCSYVVSDCWRRRSDQRQVRGPARFSI